MQVSEYAAILYEACLIRKMIAGSDGGQSRDRHRGIVANTQGNERKRTFVGLRLHGFSGL